MGVFEFTLKLNRTELADEDIDALYEAGLDDASVEDGPGGAYVHVTREAASLAAAISSAVAHVEAVRGLEAVGAYQDDFVTLTDIARRAGRSYESVRLLVAGRRGHGGFPAPSWTTTGGERFWNWHHVARWLAEQLGVEVEIPPHELVLADRLLAARHALREEPEPEVRREMETLLRPAC